MKDAKRIVEGVKLFLLDMDGTVYLGRRWIDGALEFLDAVLQSGREYAFLTNNASASARDYVKKLAEMGLEIPDRRIVTSGQAMCEYAASEFAGKSVFVLGTPSFKQELREAGINVSEQYAQAAIVSFHTSLTYREMCVICDMVRDGLPYAATHPDLNCPTESGFIPDAGANIAFIEASAGRRPDIILGKPNPGIIEFAMRRFGQAAAHTAMVGDRLYTDVAAGLNAGAAAILVMSGETDEQTLTQSDIKPTLRFNSAADITPLL